MIIEKEIINNTIARLAVTKMFVDVLVAYAATIEIRFFHRKVEQWVYIFILINLAKARHNFLLHLI